MFEFTFKIGGAHIVHQQIIDNRGMISFHQQCLFSPTRKLTNFINFVSDLWSAYNRTPKLVTFIEYVLYLKSVVKGTPSCEGDCDV